jgi:ABC-type multidrug transport system fused ATPase/permease subunit
MEKGRFVAEGSLQKLLDNSPEFQDLWQHQENKE